LLNQIAAIHGTGVAASTTSYESIATVTVGAGGSSSISFSSIPSTFKHLQVRGLVQLANGSGELDFRFNGDTGSNYSYHRIYGNGASVVAEAGVSTSQATVGYYLSATNVFNGIVVDILDYANTNKNTTTRSLNGMDTNGSGLILFDSSLWRNTAAITSIEVFSKDAGRPLTQYSQFALYGIKG